MDWNFQREESKGFSSRVPEGKHRIRVKSAEMAVSSKGNNMLTLQFDVSGYNETLYHYITFMKDNPQMTNRMLTQFFDSFKDIPDGNKNLQSWIGKVGACTVKHEDYNGNTKSKVGYFIAADKQSDLPAWVEPANSGSQSSGGDEFMKLPENIDEEVPF